MEEFKKNVLTVSIAFSVFACINYKFNLVTNNYMVNLFILRCGMFVLLLMVIFLFFLFMEKERLEDIRVYIRTEDEVDVTSLTHRNDMDLDELSKRKSEIERCIKEDLGGD